MAQGNWFDMGDGYMIVSAASGAYAYFSSKFIQVASPKYAWLIEHQPILTAAASILAILAGFASFAVHVKKYFKDK